MPNDPLNYHNLARSYGLLEQYDEARKNFKKAEELYKSQGNYKAVEEVRMTLEELDWLEEMYY